MSVAKVKKEEYENVVDLYKQGMTQPEIARIYGCSTTIISKILKKMGIETRLGGSNNTKDVVAQMCEMYKGGKLLKEIANEFNTTRATVSKLLKKNGVDVDRYTYHFNEHYFDYINSPDKAYILGMLWADGHNCVDKGSIILELQEQDKELLDKINKITENERPIKEIRLNDKNPMWQNQYKLTWQSKYTSKILEQYGMHQRKSLILEFPTCINPALYSHFIRGYMDGDGCISTSKSDKFVTVNMVGTKMFLDTVRDIVEESLNISVDIKRDNRARDPICILRCGRKEDARKLLDWIYCDANLFLTRKYEKYQLFLSNYNNINNSCAV